jgi:hypothetical protein
MRPLPRRIAAVAAALGITLAAGGAVVGGSAGASTGDLSNAVVAADTETVTGSSELALYATCPAGDVAVSGGFNVSVNMKVRVSEPDITTNGNSQDGTWAIVVDNTGSTDVAQVFAICVAVDS